MLKTASWSAAAQQRPARPRATAALANFLPFLITEPDVIRYGISLWWLWISCPAVSPPSSRPAASSLRACEKQQKPCGSVSAVSRS